ncbi:MAG TPA: deoxynucleoside kinase [Candidatus Saccharimonadales bacterium]|nr:deoxynucleoside kinase [Candidatus Saccharimonadales bacterium]
MAQHEQAPHTLTIIGPEGAGKTTLRDLLAPAIGGLALTVPEWPSLQPFLADPHAYAYDNQRDALSYTTAAYAEATYSDAAYIVADNCPDRIHLTHSWRLREEGHIDDDQWAALEAQYTQAATEWGTSYVFLDVSRAALQSRLVARKRPEDIERNLAMADWTSARWKEIITRPDWRMGKHLLELNGEEDPVALRDVVQSWLGIERDDAV